MNRLICRRISVNIFWATIYAMLFGYVFYANYVAKLNPDAKVNDATVVEAVVHVENGSSSEDANDSTSAELPAMKL